MSMTCPQCGAWTSVKETRTKKQDNVVTRRYECANGHRFSTEERIKDELLRRALRESRVQPGQGLPSSSGTNRSKAPRPRGTAADNVAGVPSIFG